MLNTLPKTNAGPSHLTAPKNPSPVAIRTNAGPNLSVIATDGALKEVSDDELLVLVGNGSRDALSISQRHAKPSTSVTVS
jgi:hypothetical protein